MTCWHSQYIPEASQAEVVREGLPCGDTGPNSGKDLIKATFEDADKAQRCGSSRLKTIQTYYILKGVWVDFISRVQLNIISDIKPSFKFRVSGLLSCTDNNASS